VLHFGRRRGTRVVERAVAARTGAFDLAIAAPEITWRMFTMLSGDERVAWIIWVWAIFALSRTLRRVRLRPSATA
jgi:hypothetical protein